VLRAGRTIRPRFTHIPSWASSPRARAKLCIMATEPPAKKARAGEPLATQLRPMNARRPQVRNNAKLPQKLGQLQSLIAVFPQCHRSVSGPTCIFWANLTDLSRCSYRRLRLASAGLAAGESVIIKC
jgi:hypothetical protein